MRTAYLAVVFCLIGATVAEAAVPPVLHGVDHHDRHPTATFGPLPGVDDATIYMASAPNCVAPLPRY